VHHQKRDAITDSVKKKLDTLVSERPFTFDLRRRDIPANLARTQQQATVKTYYDKPAMPEGCDSWWNSAKSLTCRCTRTFMSHAPRGPDQELTAALESIEKPSVPHTKDNCCWIRCEIHIEKAFDPNRTEDDTVKTFMSVLFGSPATTQAPAPAVPMLTNASNSQSVTVHSLQAVADDLMLNSKHTDAIAAYTKALSLPMEQRGSDDDSRSARLHCLLKRADARIETGDLEAAVHDCCIVLKREATIDKKWVAQAMAIYGKTLMRKKMLPAAVAFFEQAALKSPSTELYGTLLRDAKQTLAAGRLRKKNGDSHEVVIYNVSDTDVDIMWTHDPKAKGITLPEIVRSAIGGLRSMG
jgi:hypothetical protein